MGKNAYFVSHKKSKQKNQDGSPKLPVASALVEGEIAINFAENVETLSIKNESGDVVTFSSDNYYTEKKLGSGFTGENSANTVTSVIESNEKVTALALADLDERKLEESDLSYYYKKREIDNLVGSGFSYSSITEVITENEEIVSSALNDLDERKLDASAYTPSVELWVSGTGENAIVQKGGGSTASGTCSVAEGNGTQANGYYSHAEGTGTQANGLMSHAEGQNTTASGMISHAEGAGSNASGSYSHAEGHGTASGDTSHAEGTGRALGGYSHAEGQSTVASGYSSHAEGTGTQANNQSEHASGQYNISSSSSTTFGDSGNTLFSVGNGTNYDTRHNAFEIRQNGDIYIVSGNSDIRLQDYIGEPITVDQVLDNTTSASTNPVSSKAVYDAVTDNELVWANAFVALSGTVSAHTANTEIHVTAADKANWNAKLDASAIADFFDDAKYEDSGTTKVINFYHGNTIKATIDASDFIVDGMVDDVRIENGNLVIDFNTASGKQDISIPLTDIFDPSNYYDKDDIDDLVGSGFTSSSITEVIIENEKIVSAALNNLDDKKLDVSAYTPSVELWVSGSGVNSAVLKGGNNTASGTCSVAEGASSNAIGNYSHAEGHATADGDASHAEGTSTKANGNNSHAEGYLTTASGQSSHAEGFVTKANGNNSHAEGQGTTASGNCSHAEGAGTQANGNISHAEGSNSNANGEYSHAEGSNTQANGQISHAEGNYTKANGNDSHAEGFNTTASGNYSHAEGDGTVANNESEHASGQFNVSNSASTEFGDSGNTLFSVGNGTGINTRHNAFEIRQNGDIYITSGGTATSPAIKLQDSIGSKADKSDLGGLKLVKVTQTEYDALTVKDPNTLYVIVN